MNIKSLLSLLLLCLIVMSFPSCLQQGELASKGTSSTTTTKSGGGLTGGQDSFVPPQEAEKKLADEINSGEFPKQCSTFALYLKENCQDNASSDKCQRTQEYFDTCKGLYGDCTQKIVIDRTPPSDGGGSTGTVDNPQFQLEMQFLQSVSDICSRNSLMLSMCNTRSHYEECSGCETMLPTFNYCDDSSHRNEQRCQPLASYYSQCQLPCQ